MFKRLMQSLTGKPASAKPPVAVSQPAAPPAEAAQAQIITVYDAHGRELQVTRADWRDNMLLPQIKAMWDQPNELYQLILNALDDGFAAEVDPASQRMLAIDPIVERAHVIRAIVLMQQERFDQAGQVLRDAIGRIGETATLLTNLAKVQAGRGEEHQADATLWKALQLDPNQDNGLGWWLARQRERGGEPAYRAALEQAAALPGSWRASLYLGRESLAKQDVPAALDQFRSVLAQAAHSTDVLLVISGDLGNAGRIVELVDLIGPSYDPETHGPQVGMNLVQAYLHLDRLDEGEALLHRLYALNIPPFKQHLDAMASQYEARREAGASSRPIDTEELQIANMPFELPIWRYGLREPQWLFANKPDSARKVTFLMLGKVMSGEERAEQQREDELGRLSRAIPLYLAESAYEWTSLHAHSLAAVVRGGGPVLFGAQDEAGERETAAGFASSTDLLVLGSIGEAGNFWTVDLGIWDTARVALIGREAVSSDRAGLEAAILELEGRVLARLGGVQSAPHDAIYTRPTAEQMQPYLGALAQSLTLSLVANEVTRKQDLWGERNLIEWPLRMALQWPEQEVFKALYLSGISHAARYGSELLGEFEGRSFALLHEMGLAKSPLVDLGPLLLHAFGRADGLAAVRRDTADAHRLAWIERVVGVG